MSIETNAQQIETNPDKKSLYPERPSYSAERNLKKNFRVLIWRHRKRSANR
jgi:hypothetical protein